MGVCAGTTILTANGSYSGRTIFAVGALGIDNVMRILTADVTSARSVALGANG